LSPRSIIDDDAALVAWKKEAAALSSRHGALARVGRDEMRQILIDLDSIFRAAPGSVHTAYKSLTEKRLGESQELFANCFDDDKAIWTLADEGAERVAELLGGLIREADRVLAYRRSQWPIASSEWLVENAQRWVLPRTGISASRTVRRNQGYDKRGILLHRILPARVEGYPVDVFDSRTVHSASTDLSKWKMGACLFQDFEAIPEFSVIRGEKHFIVTGTKCPSAQQTVTAQVDSCLEENCVGLVWPELTVPTALRKEILKLFADRPLTDEREAPEFLVPGTWHESEDGEVVNRTRLYDGYGVERLAYDKIAPYADDDWGKERIRPGGRICVLATEGALLGLAVCLDFCDVVTTAFSELDLDVMLVPSMGNDRTMQGHQATAATLELKFGTRSFVVQHTTNTKFQDGRLGTILPLPKEPLLLAVDELGQKATWHAYNWPLGT